MPTRLPIGLGFLGVGLSGQTPFLVLGLAFLAQAVASLWARRER